MCHSCRSTRSSRYLCTNFTEDKKLLRRILLLGSSTFAFVYLWQEDSEKRKDSKGFRWFFFGTFSVQQPAKFVNDWKLHAD